MSLLLHCGGKPASFEDICRVEVPEQTETYRPVPHADLVRLITREVDVRLGLGKPEMSFGLNREGQQLFGTLVYKLGGDYDGRVDLSGFRVTTQEAAMKQYGLTIGIRNSYDKSISCGVCAGTTAFVCDNLCFHGSAVTVLAQKHTPKVWESLVPRVMVSIEGTVQNYVKTVTLQEGMKQVHVGMERGYEVLGIARGYGVLTPSQFNEALREWQAMNLATEHKFKAEANNAYGLYAAVTHSLKLGHVGRKIDEYTGASQLFEDLQLTVDLDESQYQRVN